MRIFGSTCYAYVQNANKLEARSKMGVFVDYYKESPAYLIYYPEVSKVERVRCVKFLEQNVCVPKIEDDEIVLSTPPTTVDSDVSDEQTTEDRNVGENENRGEDSRYPKRIHTKPRHLDGYVLGGGLEDDANYTVDYCYRVANIPTTYDHALKSNEATKWQKAMQDEMTALYDNDTFELVTTPEGRQIVGGKWVFAVKTGPEGDETHKARYVAKGYSQIAEIDYQETFAPTARMSSVRMLLHSFFFL